MPKATVDVSENYIVMSNSNTTSAAQNLGLLLARIPLGLYFAIDGYSRIAAPGGVSAFVKDNLGSTMRFMPEAVARGYLSALPYLEILVAIMLVFGLFQRFGAVLAAGALVMFTLTTGVNHWMAGPPFNQCLIFLGLTVALLTIGPGKISADNVFFKPKKKPAHQG